MGASSCLKRRSLAAVAVLFAVGGLMGCTQEESDGELTPLDEAQMPARGYFMGILPTAGDDVEIGQAYEDVKGHSEFVPVWGRPSPFYQLADDLSGGWGKQFVTEMVRGRSMFPLIHMSFIDKAGGKLVLQSPPELESPSLSDPAWRSHYLKAVEEVVKASRPLYISLGNEVNRWFEEKGIGDENSDGFQHWVSLYEEAYSLVKSLSPMTKVFCVFAREVVSENREADLKVLELFDPTKLDLLIFTSYAFAVQNISLPSDVPDDYFSRAFDHIPEMPIGFSELGWPVHPAFGGEGGQAEFLQDVATRLTVEEGLDLELLAWNWLHDLGGTDTSGLAYRNGTRKQAYDVWRDLSDRG